jgi:hypothetical protein
MRAKLWDPKFQYANAEASRKPGYLAERFKTIYAPRPASKREHEVLALRRSK